MDLRRNDGRICPLMFGLLLLKAGNRVKDRTLGNHINIILVVGLDVRCFVCVKCSFTVFLSIPLLRFYIFLVSVFVFVGPWV